MAALATCAQLWLSAWLEAINHTARSDPERAVAEAVRLIRLCEVALCVSSGVFALFLARFFQLGLREARLPPSGWWSLGAWRAVVGPSAQRMSRIGLTSSLFLLALSVGAVLVIESLLRALLSGRPAV